MKSPIPLLLILAWCALAAPVFAANPFLASADDKPVSARFKGTEWGDRIGGKNLPLSARVVVTRIAQAPWGAIFKVSFEHIASRTDPRREIFPVYFTATDSEIALFNEEKPGEAAQRLAAQPAPPAFEPGDIRAINQGTRHSTEGVLTETNIIAKDERCSYQWTHNSGHFATIVWQKGVGLIEYAQGYGARADGYRLKRETGAKNHKR